MDEILWQVTRRSANTARLLKVIERGFKSEGEARAFADGFGPDTGATFVRVEMMGPDEVLRWRGAQARERDTA